MNAENFSSKAPLALKWHTKNQLGYTCTPGMLPRYYFLGMPLKVNNAMMYLFTEIRYDLDSTDIEKLSSPGQITSLFGFPSQPDDFSISAGQKYCWNKDTTTHASSAEFAESVTQPAAHYTPARNP